MADLQDPQSLDNRKLSAIARNPSHPMHTHAKSELDRRKVKKSELGEMNEDGHTDVPSAIRGCKTTMEDAMQIMKKLQSMSGEDSLPSWWTNKLAVASNSMNKLRDYIMTPSNMEEKTLTPAEIRKRDKIAKAIKKDDPDMPMDKKMAIATATAKRVAESKVDEVSSKTLSNYMRKSAADAGKPRQSARTQDKRIGGQKMADDKLRKMQGKGSAAKVAATEDVNEAATPAMKKAADELNSYAKKHGGIDKTDFMKTAKMLSTGKAGMSLIKFVDGQDTDVYEKIIRVMAKHMGKQTVEKMFKVNIREEVNTRIMEISNKTLTRYAMSADNDVQKRRSNRPAGKGDESDPKIGKRLDKINLAHKKGAFKEESVNELSKDTMQSYWDKTKGDDAFSGTRKANNRLKGAINVTTKLDKLKKMVNKNKK